MLLLLRKKFDKQVVVVVVDYTQMAELLDNKTLRKEILRIADLYPRTTREAICTTSAERGNTGRLIVDVNLSENLAYLNNQNNQTEKLV